MGASSSSLSEQAQTAAQIQTLNERLRSMRVADNEPDYLVVEKSTATQREAHDEEVSVSSVEKWLEVVLSDPKNRLAISALSSNSLPSVLTNRSSVINDTHTFNVRIPHEGSPVTNQRSSGRCWIFASCNVFRIAIMQRYNLKSFELSQAYLFFWDKLEKANYFLENVIDTIDEPLDGRLLQSLMASPVGDGGQFDMIHNLVQKYGLVPQVLYPDSFNAMNSSAMGRLITTKLREDCLKLRALASDPSTTSTDLGSAKEKMLKEVHLILTLMLGAPPSPSKEFTWNFTDASDNYNSVTTTPLAFASQLSEPKTVRALQGTDVNRLFSIVHDPRHEYYTKLTVDRLGNVWKAKPVTYVNLDIEAIKKACVAQIRAGVPVFFGSDVGKSSDSGKGIMDQDLIDYDAGFNLTLGMDKAQRLQTGESAMTHAMVLTGVHVVDGKTVRWRVENSWSETAGDKGYFVCTDAWFDEWVYQAVVDPVFVSKEVRNVLDKEATVLPLWDPMGALA